MRRSGSIAVAATSLLLSILAPIASRAATPSEGTLKPPNDSTFGEKAKLEYDGGPTAGGLVFQDTAAQPVCGQNPDAAPPVQCDVFTLHVDIPATYWSQRSGVATGHLEFTIEWDARPDNPDIDLIVTDAAGNEVAGGETDNFSDETQSEIARLLEPDAGDYRVIAVGIVGGVPSYRGRIRFMLEKPEAINVRPATSIQFGPATVVDPTIFGGEPGLNGDPARPGTWYVDWPVSSRAMVGTVHRSTDGGDTFRLMTDPSCPQRRQPGCLTGGGGDTEVAVSNGGHVYFSNQEVLANEAACASPDRGTNWPSDRCNAITSLDPQNDRQWLAVYDDDTAYLAASALTGESIVRTEDGGKTWINPHVIIGEADDAPAAPIVMDPKRGPNGTLYVATGRGPITMNVSTDKAESFTAFPNDDDPQTGLWFAQSLFIPWLTKDTAGNLYAVWTDPADHAVYMSTMMPSAPQNAGARLGSRWSPPTRVSVAPARSTVFTQIAAGDPGRVAVTFQGADTGSVSDDVPDGTKWNVYASFSSDALCWWTKSCKGVGPAFEQTVVSKRANHINEICVSGIGCTVNGKDRTLLDFFDIGIDTDGRAGITWTDTQNGLGEGTIMFAKLVNGPSLYTGKSFRAQLPAGAVKARTGDAVWPVNGATGTNNRADDLTGTSLAGAGSDLKITVKVAETELAKLADGTDAGYQTQKVKYVTRWHFDSATEGSHAYFVAMEYDAGGNAVFYGGKIDAGDELYSPVSGPTATFGMKYVKDFDVEGSLLGTTMAFTVPRAKVGDPKDGDTLFSVQSFAIAGLDDRLQTLYTAPDTIDATPPVNVRLGAASVLGKNVKKPAPKTAPKTGGLPATGDEAAAGLGLTLLALAALTMRIARRRPA